MYHEDVMSAVAELNEAIEKAERLARLCRKLVSDIYSIPEFDDEDKHRSTGKYPWDVTDGGGEFFFPCDDADEARVRVRLAASARYRYGKGGASVKRVMGGFRVIRNL